MLVTKMICIDMVTNLIQEGQAHVLFKRRKGQGEYFEVTKWCCFTNCFHLINYNNHVSQHEEMTGMNPQTLIRKRYAFDDVI
jgi:hypothetical protein